MKLDNTDLFEKISLCQKQNYSSLPDYVKDAYEKEMLLRLSWNTNHLEGNTLSLDETIDVIEYDEVQSGHTYSEYREAKSAYRADKELLDFRTYREITLEYICKANGIIMDSDGRFRTNRVYIGILAESAYVPPAPEEVPSLMNEYCRRLSFSQYGGNIGEIIVKASCLHMDFEQIHPFQDGNGRTGRLFLNQYLLNSGLLPVIIENNSKYRQAFHYYDRNGDTSFMEHCIAKGILRAYNILRENCAKLMYQ